MKEKYEYESEMLNSTIETLPYEKEMCGNTENIKLPLFEE